MANLPSLGPSWPSKMRGMVRRDCDNPLNEFDAINHFTGLKFTAEKAECADNISYAASIDFTVHDAGMITTSGGDCQEIIVIGENDSMFAHRKIEMLIV